MISNIGDKATLALNNQKLPQINSNVDEKKLKEQTDAFESIIIKMLLDTSMKDQKDLFSKANDPGEKIYKSMYREELSKKSAGSFGISELLFNYLSEKI